MSIGLPAVVVGGAAHICSQVQLVQVLAVALLLFALVKIFLVLTSPSDLLITEEKLEVAQKLLGWQTILDSIKWRDLTSIRTFHPPEITDPQSWELELFAENKVLAIKLGGLTSAGDREALLKAIEKYAADVPRDADVSACLRPPQDQTYTELWLAALTQAPQRQKLLPLEEGALLKSGKYVINTIIGSGGQGLVYSAYPGAAAAGTGSSEATGEIAGDTTRKVVVIDEIKGEIAESAATTQVDNGSLVIKEAMLPLYVGDEATRKAVERFDHDARLLSRLESPHVAKIVDHFIEDHRSYLVTERIFGENLREKIAADGPMPTGEILELLEQMLACLQYIHGRTPPVVHRDFTPDNLILDKDGRLVLIDFEVAREQTTKTVATTVGKQAYIPPEQLRGQAEPASDIYALGATLYFLATGQDPEPLSRSSLPLERNGSETRTQQLLNEIIAGTTQLDAGKRMKLEQITNLMSHAIAKEPA